METKFFEIIKEHKKLENFQIHWKLLKDYKNNPIFVFWIKYYLMKNLKNYKRRTKSKDKKLSKLINNIIDKLQEEKKALGKPRKNQKEMLGKILETYKKIKTKYDNGEKTLELLYEFKKISELFKVMTVFDISSRKVKILCQYYADADDIHKALSVSINEIEKIDEFEKIIIQEKKFDNFFPLNLTEDLEGEEKLFCKEIDLNGFFNKVF